MKRLTPEQFDAAAGLSRMGDDTRAWARAVLVDGRRQSEVARESGKNRQNIAQAVRQLLKWHDEAEGVETVRLDADLVAEIDAVMRRAEARKKNKPA
jgi:hypothetical protein